MCSVVVFGLALQALFAHADVTVYHRLQHPLSPEAPFTERGTLKLRGGSAMTFRPVENLLTDLETFSNAFDSISTMQDRALYQVAIRKDSREWDISSVKAVSS
jgi:ER membrane protein complex subunit 10